MTDIAEYLRKKALDIPAQFVGGAWSRRLREIRERISKGDFDYLSWDIVKKTMIVTATEEVMRRQFSLYGDQYFNNVYEFGAGLLTRRSWVRHMNYTVYDLPEMTLLQRYISQTVNITSDLSTFLSFLRDNSYGPTAFFATWSLSECPISIRDIVLETVTECCDTIFLAYQPVFDFIDNDAYFTDFVFKHKEFQWTWYEAKPLDGSYLGGRRNRWT